MGIEARNLQQIYDYIDEFEKRVNRKGIWYRGSVNYSYDLVPSLQRSLPRNTYHSKIQEIEKKMFDIFKDVEEFQGKKFTDWELLYLMQHYGVKTRFLDWSFNPLVSLFFATYNWDKKQNARLWLLDPYLLNEVFHGKPVIVSPKSQKSYFDFLESYTVSNNIYAFDGYQLNYGDFNKRIKAQSGVFTLHLARNTLGAGAYSLNNILGTQIFSKKKSEWNPLGQLREDFPDTELVLDYIDIVPETAEEIQGHLLEKDITIKTLFPDLPGVVDYINSVFPEFN